MLKEIKSDSDYLEFNEIPSDGRKTLIFQVVSKQHGYPIGEIKWFNKYRQYCFYPGPGTIFNRTCLKDIQDFIIELVRITR